MALVETTAVHDDRFGLTEITLALDHGAHDLLVELMERTGWDASELVGWALGAQWRELEGVILPPPPPDEDVEKVLAESEADIAAGRTVSNEDVFGRIAAKHGW